MNANFDLIGLRDISSVFSRSAFVDILDFNDYSHFDWILSKYDYSKCSTYLDLIKKTYSSIAKDYRCEYVYKNELIKHLIKEYGVRNTVYFSEFRVGKSIADIVMFNGESKVFEIKTEYDTIRRLDKQLNDYKCFFDKSFVVIPASRYNDYYSIIDSSIGIIIMIRENGRIKLEEARPAEQNNSFDVGVLMSCLRMEEYKNIASSLGGTFENVPGYDLFSYCYEVMSNADTDMLKKCFLREVKKRKNNTSLLRKYPSSVRQMMLSLNLSEKKADILLKQLNTNIN